MRAEPGLNTKKRNKGENKRPVGLDTPGRQIVMNAVW